METDYVFRPGEEYFVGFTKGTLTGRIMVYLRDPLTDIWNSVEDKHEAAEIYEHCSRSSAAELVYEVGDGLDGRGQQTMAKRRQTATTPATTSSRLTF